MLNILGIQMCLVLDFDSYLDNYRTSCFLYLIEHVLLNLLQCHIPIFSPDKIQETKPDYVLILPWNLKDEIIEQMNYINNWGGKFVIPIPKVSII